MLYMSEVGEAYLRGLNYPPFSIAPPQDWIM